MSGERTTLKAIIGVGLAVWLFAIAWPGMQVAPTVLGGLLVAWSVYRLLTDARRDKPSFVSDGFPPAIRE